MLRKNRLYRSGREQSNPLMALELALASFCFLVLYKIGPDRRSFSLYLFSSGTAHGCTEDDDHVDNAEGDEEVLQLISLIDSRYRPESSSGARCKTTGARAEARVVGTTQPLAPDVSFGHSGHCWKYRGALRSRTCRELSLQRIY